MKKKEVQARQGDLFFSVSPAPTKDAKRQNHNVLAYGEVTGHKHQVITPSLDKLDVFVEPDGHIVLHSATEDIEIDHEEHGKITLPKGGWYKVTRQREYDAITEEVRQVAD